jgi:preprotein translocase subunit YajC
LNSALNFLLLPLILVVGYVLLVRPQQMRVRRQQELLSSIEPGDEVVTAAGIVGRVEAIDGDRARVEVAPGTTVVFLKQAISGRLGPRHDQGSEGGKVDGG